MNELKLVALVHDVANAMSTRGESWVLVGDEAKRGFGVDMRSRDGEIVNFQQARNPAQLFIEGCDPLTVHTTGKSIHVTASRHPLAIAREIANRLLPDYREALAGRRDREAKARAAFEARVAAVNAAEALFGQPSDFGEFDPARLSEYRTEVRLSLRGKHVRQMGRREHAEAEFTRVTADNDGSLMGLELSDVPAEVVMRMLAVLAEHNATFLPA